VFTHGDLAPRNIIVKDGKIAALLDWEVSGWYPEYWEYVKFFRAGTSDVRDMWRYAEDIFPERYDDELVEYAALSKWQCP
jgi:aminoglycoside phosphotransferase (APT) family kinase protein